MNFQTIRDSLGQMDGKYQAKTDLTAVIKQVKPVEYSKSSGKPGQSLYIELDSGERDWVKFTGKDVAESPLDHNAMDQNYALKVWPFQPEATTKVYLYCWIQRQVPQGSPQRPQNAPQGIKPPPGIDTESQILAMAERFLKAIETLCYPNAAPDRPTQPSGPNPDYVGDDPSPPDDEVDEHGNLIPF